MSDINKTLADRGLRYGKFADHAAITQAFKQFTREEMGNKWEGLQFDQQEALDMIFHKIGRIVTGDPNWADSWHDIAGYATLVEKRLNGESV